MRFLKASFLFLISMIPYSAQAVDRIVFIKCEVNVNRIEPYDDKFVENFNFGINYDLNKIKMYMKREKRYIDICLGNVENDNFGIVYSNCTIEKDKINIIMNIDNSEIDDIENIYILKSDIKIYRASGEIRISMEQHLGNIRNYYQGYGTCDLGKEIPDESLNRRF